MSAAASPAAPGMPFLPYPSVPTRLPSGANTQAEWLVTHKYHGTNLGVCVRRGGAVTFSRRNGALAPGESHYSHAAVTASIDWAAFTAPWLALPSTQAVWVFCELYGGWFPGTERLPGASVVQKGIGYARGNHVRVFDVFLQCSPDDWREPASGQHASTAANPHSGASDGGRFLPFDDVAARCAACGVPCVPVMFRGPFDAAAAWAAEHAADAAVVEPDVADVPLPAGTTNAGEGSVLRCAVGHTLVKVKNPAWNDIAAGAGANAAAGPGKLLRDPSAPCEGAEFLTPGRVASVFSKLPQAALARSNMKQLAALVKEDALAAMAPEAAASASAAPAFSKACFRACVTALDSLLAA